METTAVSPPEAEVMPSVVTPPQLLYATGWQRTGAMLIDGILCGLPFFLVMKLFYEHPLLSMNLTNLLFFLYYVIPESRFRFGSPGKMLLGIYVAKSDGSPVSLGCAGWRYFLWILPAVPLLVIGYMPELLAYSAAVGENDPEKLRVLLSDPATREALRLQFFCLIGALVASLLLQAMPMFATKEKIGLHDWLSNTRVYRKPDRAPAYFATPSQRCGAMVLDTIAATIFSYPIKFVIDDFNTQYIVGLVLGLAYFAVLESSRLQASLGKHMIGIKVCTAQGKPPTLLHASLRVMLFYMPSIPMIVWAALSPTWQIMGDIAAHEGDKVYIRQLMTKIISDPAIIASIQFFGVVALSSFALQIVLNYLPIIFTRQRIGLQDWLSGTRVYRRDAAPGA